MISISNDGTINVNWVQNGIRNQKKFKSMKKAEEYADIIKEVQNSIKLCEEVDKFNKNFKYDPKLVNLKIDKIHKEINQLKESTNIKEKLQKKFGKAVKKLAEQPRNVIDKDTFFRETKSLRQGIEALDRLFKESALLSLQVSMKETLEGMKGYFKQQKEGIRETKELFKQVEKDILQKFSSITTKDKVLSIKEVAKYLGMSYSGVQAMMFMKKLPYFLVGNRYKIKENDLAAWIAKNKGSNVAVEF